MKKALLLLVCLLGTHTLVLGQGKFDIDSFNIQTQVFILNLGTPHSKSLIAKPMYRLPRGEGKHGLKANSNQPIAFQLVNGNPLKYRYKLDYTFINLFSDPQQSTAIDSVFFKTAKLPEVHKTVKSTTKTYLSLKNTQQYNLIIRLIDSLTKENALLSTKSLVSFKLDTSKLRKVEKISQKQAVERVVQSEHYKTKYKELQLQSFKYQKNKDLICRNIIDFVDSQYCFIDISKLNTTYKKEIELFSVNMKHIDNMKNVRQYAEENIEKNVLKLLRLMLDTNDIIQDYHSISAVFLQKSINLRYKMDVHLTALAQEDYLDSTQEANIMGIASQIKILLNDLHELDQVVIKYPSMLPRYYEYRKQLIDNIDYIREKILFIHSIQKNTYLLPIDVNGKNIDALRIKLRRYRKDTDATTPLDEYSYTIWLKGGLKFDFSAGVFISSLVDKEYSLQKDTDTNNSNNMIIKQAKKGNFDFGFGTMLNMSLRTAGWIKPSFNVGLLLKTQQKFQMLVGGGAIFGKEERLVLHAGLAVGQVAVLDNGYEVNSSYNLGTATKPPTTDKFMIGSFFGITYSLTKPKIQNPITPETY
ncbi:hypothetical protein SAMN05421780_10446 [Flexibacter flexilis DSM 6793]|uniref:Outer membrane protein beta-barrel domain-containing protein n=1 Tax=Flexibacter flexilis DSM 6793 TaxID=927664 RepID=A0A1I1HWS9_9BACT|nr:hypothetical protein [Flexibacter flexilis]SFC25903.1 hypothetical protein SAMN05421780_10446 [Flexibacter flexilis DSM 6793]